MRICIFGAANEQIDRSYKEAAFEVGRQPGKAGIPLVFGGGGEGMMGACARGTHAEGGFVTGIVPEFFTNGVDEVLYEECDEVIYTPDLHTRIQRMNEMSDGFIVLPGGVGTLEEFFDILAANCLHRIHKFLAVFNIDGYYDPQIAMLQRAVDQGFMFPERMEQFRAFRENQIPEMIEYIRNFK